MFFARVILIAAWLVTLLEIATSLTKFIGFVFGIYKLEAWEFVPISFLVDWTIGLISGMLNTVARNYWKRSFLFIHVFELASSCAFVGAFYDIPILIVKINVIQHEALIAIISAFLMSNALWLCKMRKYEQVEQGEKEDMP